MPIPANISFPASLKLFFSGVVLLITHTLNAQIACPPNIDFEFGTTASWSTYIGTCCPIVTPTLTTSPVVDRHTVTSGPGVDPYGLFPIVAPGSGAYSLKLGNSGTGAQAEKVRYTIHVPSTTSNFALFYRYAVVEQNPSHTLAQQPRFEVNAYDSATGLPIPCASYNYYSTAGMPGFAISTHPSSTVATPIYYKPWTDASINLTGWGGSTVIVDFSSGDCSLGGHFGYGYLDMECSLFAISVSPCDTVSPLALSAPSGFMTYEWYDSTTFSISYGTTETVTVPYPPVSTTYAVIITPYTGYGCPDTLYTNVDPSGITIIPPPNADTITGPTIVCEGSTIALTDTASGGVWSSSSSNAFVVAGTVTGVTAGTATISYTVTNSCGTDIATHDVTVNPLPVAGTISGSPSVCQGASASLTPTVSGGTWSASNTHATISPAGIATGVFAGTDTISYGVTNSCGIAFATFDLTINPLPGPILGNIPVCPTASITLSNAVAGGTWSCSPSSIATISSMGDVSAISPGTAIVTYTNSCGTATAVVTVNGVPGPITGNMPVCPGNTFTLSNSLAGGTWACSAATIATISSSGVVTGVAPGMTTVSYVTVCATQTKVVTVTPLPGLITGNTPVCPGNTITLGNPLAGGTWSCVPAGTATISATGIVAAITSGTAIVSYVTTCGSATTNVTVNDLPGAITGNTPVCPGNTITLSNSLAGGTWSCAPSSVATIGTSGDLLAIAAGTATVAYATTCTTVSVVVSVNPVPGPVTGNTPVCPGNTITLGNSLAGGTWSCAPASVATISAGGDVSAISAGIATVSYVTTCGTVTASVTVNTLPGAITGNAPVCPGNTITLSNSLAGGIWSCTPATIATISSSGIVNAVAPGTATISYATTCVTVSVVVTVNELPGLITGNVPVCPGNTITLSNSLAGGVWSCAPPTIATISTSGIVSAIATGTAIVSYATACATVSATVTVNGVSGPITGNVPVCPGNSITLSNVLAGGTWSCAPSSVATIGSSGIVAAISAGTVMVSYVTTCGVVTTVVTVNALPGPITGNTPVCPGNTIGLGNSLGGGVWSCSPASIATISSSGIVSAIAAGTAVVSYATTCATVSAIVTVNALPGTITGNAPVCPGNSITLGNSLPGGTWSCTPTSVATVSTTGVLTGVTSGTATVSYVTTCTTVVTIATVNAVSGPITGNAPVCPGSTIALGNSLGGGAWTCAPATVATISPTGVVTAIAAGTAAISYATTCSTVSAVVTVNALPGAITGNSPLCPGNTITLSNTLAGGTWSCTPAGVATIASSGIVTAVAGGTATVSYGTTCATMSVIVTVHALPGAITGNTPVCPGNTITLGNSLSGGTWSCAPSGIATIAPSGFVTAVAAGTATVSYATTCITVSAIVTVNPVPGPITGNAPICPGNTVALANSLTGGTWSCTPSTVATITASGVVTAMGAGTAFVSYTTTCTTVSLVVTVNGLPGPITGNAPVCPANTITLGNSLAGGTWSCTPAMVATISPTGAVTALTTGTAVVSYVTTCASVSAIVTVHALPGTITGNTPVCPGTGFTVSNSLPGGVWSSSPTSVATISASGNVSAISSGIAVVSYTTTCITVYAIVTVHPLAGPITGNAPICPVYMLPLSNSAPGGTWSCSPSSVATINSSGIVTSIALGTATVNYVSTCNSVSAVVTVSATPLPITGNTPVCAGGTIPLSDPLPGGTWSCTPATVATISSTGLVSTLAAGTAVVVYTTTCGSVVTVITSNPVPGAITGNVPLCAGANITLGNSLVGGIWSCSPTSVAMITPSGVLTGTGAGTATVLYATGCGTVAATATVNALPGTITGNSPVCIGSTMSLGNPSPGGTWSCPTPSVATVSATGLVTAISIGTALVSYVTPCGVTHVVVTVTPLVGPITGNVPVCIGGNITLSNVITGLWISTAPSVATISPSGVVTGISTGTALITFTSACGIVTTVLTVNPLPGPIAGNSPICVGNTITLSNPMPGGTWVSLAPSVVVLGATGVATGVAAGTALVSYAVAGCGSPAIAVTVMATPSTIAGNVPVCSGNTITLTNLLTGGAWSCLPAAVATITASGVVSGIAAGTATVSYTTGACSAAAVVTVNESPVISGVTSTQPVCTGAAGSITLSGLVPGASYTVHYTALVAVTVTIIADGSGRVTIPGLASGTYSSISVTDAAGCISNVVGPVVLPGIGMPADPVAIVKDPCEGDSLKLSATCATPGVSLSWAGPAAFTAAFPDAVIYPSSPGNSGTYTVTGTLGICTTVYTVSVTVHAKPTVSKTATGNPGSCSAKDGWIEFEGLVPGESYTINYVMDGMPLMAVAIADGSGRLRIPALALGAYSNIVIRSSHGCASSVLGPVTLSFPGAPPLPVIEHNDPCVGQDLTLAATDAIPGGSYYWFFPDGGGSPLQSTVRNNMTSSAAGIYKVTYTVMDCEVSATANVLVSESPVLVNVTGDQTIALGGSVQLNAEGATSYSWLPNEWLSFGGINSPLATPKETITYTVVGTNDAGCVDSAKVTIKVEEIDEFIPTAFTPDGDGRNDIFRIRSISAKRFVEFSVYNRGGERIYHNNSNPDAGWDGTYRDKPCDIGTYFYHVIVREADGSKGIIKGDVTLIR